MVLTGTPPGVGCFRKPPLYLKVSVISLVCVCVCVLCGLCVCVCFVCVCVCVFSLCVQLDRGE